MVFDIEKVVRPNIRALLPYRCARDDYKEGILLDANENAYGSCLDDKAASEILARGVDVLHRYPDPHQTDTKRLICDFRNKESTFSNIEPLNPDNLFVGVGSDEAIDNLIRCFCAPGKEKLLTCPPTYGMYSVSAQVNDVQVVKVNLDISNKFRLKSDAVIAALDADPLIKLVYLCSPGNPTGALINVKDVERVLSHNWNGIVVVDEAYIDFSPLGSSVAPLVNKYPNLVVMQTLSKSFGLAGIRFGMAFASPKVANLLNNIKAPYNISVPTTLFAQQALSPESIARMRNHVSQLNNQRARMVKDIKTVPLIGDIIGGLDANFFLVQILNPTTNKPDSNIALQVYENLAQTKGVVVRFRGNELGCVGALRITVGTQEENSSLLQQLRLAVQEIKL